MENRDQRFTRSAMLLRSIWNVQKNMMRFIQKVTAENGITVPQYVILLNVAPIKEMTQKVVGEKTQIPKSTLSQSIDGLVQAGLIEREHVEGNRRETQLMLTDKGEAFIKKVHLQEGGIHEVMLEAVNSMSEKQFQELLDAHLKIVSCVEAHISEEKEA